MSPDSRAQDPETDTARLRRAFGLSLGFVLAIWRLKLVEIGFARDLGRFGALQRTADCLWGIRWGR